MRSAKHFNSNNNIFIGHYHTGEYIQIDNLNHIYSNYFFFIHTFGFRQVETEPKVIDSKTFGRKLKMNTVIDDLEWVKYSNCSKRNMTNNEN